MTLVRLLALLGRAWLLENGRSHPGSWNSAAGTIEATIDGERYTGTYSDPPPIRHRHRRGRRQLGWRLRGVGVSTGTGCGGGCALLRSTDGSKVIECYFAASFGSGQGSCQGLDGQRFVLVIGS